MSIFADFAFASPSRASATWMNNGIQAVKWHRADSQPFRHHSTIHFHSPNKSQLISCAQCLWLRFAVFFFLLLMFFYYCAIVWCCVSKAMRYLTARSFHFLFFSRHFPLVKAHQLCKTRNSFYRSFVLFRERTGCRGALYLLEWLWHYGRLCVIVLCVQ